MTDNPALVAAVCDRPDDDTPRKVYADWCDDQGDPGLAARAAFIRAQVRLAEVGGRVPSPGEFQCRKPKTRQIGDGDVYGGAAVAHVYTGPCGACDWCALTREAAGAFAAMPGERKYIRGGDGIGKWIVPFGDQRQWARGFPEVCRSMHSTFWRDHHAAILAAAPIRRVELVDVPEVTFGPARERTIHVPTDRRADTRTDWEATWGGHVETFALQTTVTHEVAYFGGAEAVQYRIDQHRAEVEEARTPLAYLQMRWPKVEFVLPYGEVPFRGGYEEWAAQPHVRAENERRLREGREGAEAARRLAAAVDRLPRPPAN